MPSTVRTARAPTDFKPNLIRVKKRDDERAHRREGGERVKEFQHMVTSDRVVGRPRAECVARVFYCECMHPRLVNAILTNICSIFIRLIQRAMEAGCVIPKKRGKLQCGVCPEKRMAKQERGWTRKVSASLMANTSHLPKGWMSERYSCSDSSACLRLRMRCATPMHSTAPPAIQVKVTPLRPVSGRPTDLVLPTLMVTSPASALVPVFS